MMRPMKDIKPISKILMVCVVLFCLTNDGVCAQGDVPGKRSAVSTNPNLFSKVSTIVLGVSSVPKSVAFYRDTLGLEVSGQSEELAFVSLSGLTLMLSADLGRAFQPIAGATEFVLPVESVTSAYSRLRERGCIFLNQPREVTPGSWAATLSDPDGHKLTVFGPR